MATDHDHFIGSSSRDGYNSICLIRFARRQSLRLRVAWRPLRSSSISFLSSNTDPLLLYGNQSEVRNHFAVIQFFNQRFFVHPSALIFFPPSTYSLVFFFISSLFFPFFFKEDDRLFDQRSRQKRIMEKSQSISNCFQIRKGGKVNQGVVFFLLVEKPRFRYPFRG